MSRGAKSFLPGLLGALGLHGLLLGGLFGSEPPKPTATPRRPPVKIRVAARPAPPPPVVEPPPPPVPAAVEPPPPPPETPPPKPRPRPAEFQAAVLAPPPAPEPPSPAPAPEPPPAPAAEPPPKPGRFAVAMEATVPGGAVAVPTTTSGGGWAYGSQDGDPDGARALAGPKRAGEQPGGRGTTDARPAKTAEVTTLPRLRAQPSAADLRNAYPEAARREGREGDVGLKLRISTAGEVVEVKILRSAGHGFDEAAVALVKTFRFEPAWRGERAVEIWIPWTYKFRLDS